MKRKKVAALFCLTILVSLFSNHTVSAQGPIVDHRFGIADTYLNPTEATAAGAGYTRITLRWDVIQPSGRDDWKPANVPDPFIDAELQAGREVVAVLIGTPAWASQGVNSTKAVPDMEAWGSFTKRMAQQYQGRIKHWIIWHEPDVWDVEHPGNTWLGTDEEYVTLLKSAYSNIKLVDPSMEVHVAGLNYYWDAQHDREQFLSRLLNIITADPEAAKHDFYFDAVPYHLYHNPREMFNIVRAMRKTLVTHGLTDKAIWINETNAPPVDDPQEPPLAGAPVIITSDEQAAFTIQAFALMIAGGAERVQFYKMRNSEDHPESAAPTGLLRADDSRRPVFDAYRVITQYFSGYTNYEWEQNNDIYAVALERIGQTVTILWTATPEDKPFTLTAIADTAILIDETGNETTLEATDGAYTLTLPGATCSAGWCLIGGAPRIIIEDGLPSQRDSLSPPVASTNLPIAALAVTATPEPASSTATTIPIITATSSPIPPTPSPLPPTETPVPVAAPLTDGASPNADPPQVIAAAAPEIAPATDNAQPLALPTFAEPSTNTTQPTSQRQRLRTTLFSQDRILMLVIGGAILFTFFYFVQFRVWHHFRR